LIAFTVWMAVEEAPEFTCKLKGTTAVEGETAVLECTVTGIPKPEIHWYRSREEIEEDERHKFEALPAGTQRLTISLVTFDDMAMYRCEAVNCAGSSDTRGQLDITLADPPTFPDSPTESDAKSDKSDT